MYDVNAGTREIKISVSFEILMKTRGYVPSDVEKMIRELLEFGAENEVENVIKTLGIIQKRLPPYNDIRKGRLSFSGIDVMETRE